MEEFNLPSEARLKLLTSLQEIQLSRGRPTHRPTLNHLWRRWASTVHCPHQN
jgi:hypothetical protein